MTRARDDYPAIAVHSRRPDAEGRQCSDALAEIDGLRRWRAEATAVISEWDALWEAAGRPGHLGQTRAAGLRAALEDDYFILPVASDGGEAVAGGDTVAAAVSPPPPEG